MTYPAFKQQAPARGVPHSLLIPVHQLSPTKQADSWEWTQKHHQRNHKIRRSAENSHMGRKSGSDEEAGSDRFGPIRGREMSDTAAVTLRVSGKDADASRLESTTNGCLPIKSLLFAPREKQESGGGGGEEWECVVRKFSSEVSSLKLWNQHRKRRSQRGVGAPALTLKKPWAVFLCPSQKDASSGMSIYGASTTRS
ncbi:hypothetical protein EYF80_013801 [Liparis tanakae]|uniref:Uncharacterized protein n=1 Tax=Liparis tanakae TaxID=230148 RepID=A0A4Z2IDG2_9TELE|nr:hypothetical protein EYF80_013801 [Liparis tanakae]